MEEKVVFTRVVLPGKERQKDFSVWGKDQIYRSV